MFIGEEYVQLKKEIFRIYLLSRREKLTTNKHILQKASNSYDK